MQKPAYDICIIGSGFCGYAAYKELSNIGLKILLVEGGKLNTPDSINEQKFYKMKKNDKFHIHIRERRETVKNELKILLIKTNMRIMLINHGET